MASRLSSGPCCEIDKLIVQINGAHHSNSQRLAIYDQAGKRLDAFTDEDKPETQEAPYFIDSALHVWDWQNNYTHRLWLEIDALDGSVIRLPLPEVAITPRQFDAQWNQIVPIIPFTPLPGVNSAHDHGTPVLCRSGFVYVFLDGRLWRELEVRVEDEKTTYHDVDMNRHRFGEHIEPGPRPAIGQPLDDIWLPASWNNQRVSPQLCFSEIQLSGPRLQRLEQDAKLREQRCQSPDLRCSRDKYKQVFHDKPDGLAMLDAFSTFNAFDHANQAAAGAAHTAWLNLNQHAFPVSVVAPQRARQPGFEWLLDQPARYLCDLSGQFPPIALGDARRHVLRCEKGEVAYQATDVETGAWAHWQQQVCSPGDELAIELWQEQPAVPDVLAGARQRHLYGVLLHDSHHRLRHLHARIHDQQQLLTLCATRASQHPHHASALLVQQLLIPRDLNGQPNPLHRRLDKLDEHAKLDLNRFTASGERTQLWRQLEMTQSLLTSRLQQPHTEHGLADHLSQDGFDYVAALHFVSRLFASLATTPAQLDPLAVSGDVPNALTGESLYSPKASVGQAWISRMANDEGHGLHTMLWPALASQDLSVAYVQPETADANEGDGRFRPNELLSAIGHDTVDPKQVNTLDAYLLSGLLTNGDLNNSLTTAFKALAATLLSFHETLQGAVDVAEQALHGAQHALIIRSERPAPAVNMRQQQRAVAQLRSMLPGGFRALHFITHQEARNKNLYVFGLTDLPEVPARLRRPHLDYRSSSGNSAVSQRHHRRGGGLLANTMVIAMPRDHRIAQLASGINQRVNAAWQENMGEQEVAKKSAIQKAVDQRDALKSQWLYRALNSTPFAAAVGMLELWNLRNELRAVEQVQREKGDARAFFGVGAAAIDLLIAMEALTVKLAGSQSALAAARKTLFVIPQSSSSRILGKTLAKRLIDKVTAQLLGQVFAGSIFVGLNLYDAWHANQWGDDALWGHLLMAAGGLSGIAGILTVGGATFLGLGPAGWISLIAISAGAGIVYLLSSSPVEDWLSRGPFAMAKDQADHLQDPAQAFYYLVSLFADIRIIVEDNPDHTIPAYSDEFNPQPFCVRNADTRIRIESNLPGLLSGLADPDIRVSCVVQETHRLHDRWNGQTHEESYLHREAKPESSRMYTHGLEIFVKTPSDTRRAVERSDESKSVHAVWRVRAQLAVKNGDSTWVFPAPKPQRPHTF